MSDMTERNAVREEFFMRHHHGFRTLAAARAAVKDAMADEIVRLRADNAALRAEIDRLERILAALREPSVKVLSAVRLADKLGAGYDVQIPAAVTAAEQEVGRE